MKTDIAIDDDKRTASEPQGRSSEWLGVGADGVIRIVNDMKNEARQWKDFASANQLYQKHDYYLGKEDALAELLKVLKVLAPTPNAAMSDAANNQRSNYANKPN